MITVNGVEIKPTIFPDGTSQVWQLPDDVKNYLIECQTIDSHAVVRWDFQSESEIIHVCQLAHLARTEYNDVKLLLDVPYLPYGRQDKSVSNDATFALITFARIINCFYNCIRTVDAHSNKLEQINNYFPSSYPKCINIFPKKEIEKAIKYSRADFACYPDKSAKERYAKHIDLPAVYMDKVRNQSTGAITGLEWHVDCLHYDLKDKSIIVIDDICDGGRTFIECAKLLKTAGVRCMSLYVSHGIFSKGLEPLENAGYSEVFTKEGLQTCPF